MKDGKSVFVVLALVVFIVYVLRGTLGRVSAFFFVPIDRLLFISHSISPVIMWMFLGLLIGAIYGSFIAIKKYRLDFKLLTYPVVIFLVAISLILLASFIKKKMDRNPGADDAEIHTKTGLAASQNPAGFNEVLNKGIAAEGNKEYKNAEKYFKQAALIGADNPRLDSLAAVYTAVADEKCSLFRRDSKLKYISNHYYKYAAILTGKLTPEVCN